MLAHLPSALVATRICTSLDLRDHTRFAATSRFFGVLCAQTAASPVAVLLVNDWPPAHAFASRPWLRPTAIECSAADNASFTGPAVRLPPFPRHLLAAARQLVWRSRHWVDTALLAAAVTPHLTALSVPCIGSLQLREIVVACPHLVALECECVSDAATERDEPPFRFELPRLQSLAIIQCAPLSADAVRNLARTCPALRDLEARVRKLDGDAFEFASLERLNVHLSGDRATQQRSFVHLCGAKLPRLRQLRLQATVVTLQPLTAFASLEVLNASACRVWRDTATVVGVACTSTRRMHLELPQPLPALTSLRLPPSNSPHLDVPSSYASTLTELETRYSAVDDDACRRLASLYPRLRHLLFYDSGTTFEDELPEESLERDWHNCVILLRAAADAAAAAKTRSSLRTLTLRNPISCSVYDTLRIVEHIRSLSACAGDRLEWSRDIDPTPEFRCVDTQLLDQRALISQRSFGDWHTAAEED